MASAPASGSSDVELEFWRSIKDSNKVEELNAYLTQYPNGQFKALALARIADLQNGPSTTTRTLSPAVDPATFTEQGTQVTEDRIGLDKGLRKDVQRRLTGLGFDVKQTGTFDEPTRAVIRRWEAARGYPATGYLTKNQHDALRGEIVSATQSASASSSDDDDRQARSSAPRRRSGGGGGGGGQQFNPIGAMMGGLSGGGRR